MLGDLVALLRERESAKAAVTDKMVRVAADQIWVGTDVAKNAPRMRRALKAVAPMLASTRVPGECTSEWSGGDSYDDGYHNGIINGWNGCREAMLAAATKPEKE